jgi:NAD(P)-dependent dehydrogenase (short-subunit alcohol dehydrogenase family)
MPTLFLTGATGALGKAIREKYLAEGWSVAGFAQKEDGFAHERYRFWSMDANDEGSVEQSFGKATHEFGTLRALIATVGGVRPWKTVMETSVEDFRALFELNLISFFLSAKHALQRMPDIGTIISIGARPPDARTSGYSSSKAGVMALTEVIAAEGKTSGITANCIVPTVIRTKANEEWGNPEDFSKWTKPEDIAAMCFFLTSEAGKAVNGAIIRMPNRM